MNQLNFLSLRQTKNSPWSKEERFSKQEGRKQLSLEEMKDLQSLPWNHQTSMYPAGELMTTPPNELKFRSPESTTHLKGGRIHCENCGLHNSKELLFKKIAMKGTPWSCATLCNITKNLMKTHLAPEDFSTSISGTFPVVRSQVTYSSSWPLVRCLFSNN